jgi:hypothetical protein
MCSPEGGVHVMRHGGEPAEHGETDVLQGEAQRHAQLGVLQEFKLQQEVLGRIYDPVFS